MKLPENQLSRRKFLATTGMAGAGLMLANSSFLTATAVAQEGGAVKRGGTHVRGDWLNVTGLDPHLASEANPVFLAPYNNLFSYRMVDAEMARHELQGELVETWEQPDDVTFVFKLRQGVKFHDGSDWNAEVAAWNLDRIQNHPKSAGKQAFEIIESVSVVDDATIEVKLKRPSASFLVMLSGADQSYKCMVSKQAVETMGETEFAANPVGTGPFRFENWIRDDSVTFTRFEDYWEMGEDGQALPYLDKLVVRYAAAPQLMLMLRSGEIEATRFINPEDIPIAKADSSLVVEEMAHNQRVEPILGFNGKSGVLHDNLKLRQALLYALNREAMANVLGFGAAKAHNYPFWGPGSLGWDESIENYDYNPEKAKQLMAEAGYPDGVDIRLMLISRPNYMRIAEVLQGMWGAVGFRTTVEPLERAAFNQKGIAGEGYDAMFIGGQIKLDPSAVESNLMSNGSLNRNAYSSPELDQCMMEAGAEYDPEKRDELYKRCLTIIQEEAYFGAAVSFPSTFVYKNYVKGYIVQWETPDTRAVWLDK